MCSNRHTVGGRGGGEVPRLQRGGILGCQVDKKKLLIAHDRSPIYRRNFLISSLAWFIRLTFSSWNT